MPLALPTFQDYMLLSGTVGICGATFLNHCLMLDCTSPCELLSSSLCKAMLNNRLYKS